MKSNRRFVAAAAALAASALLITACSSSSTSGSDATASAAASGASAASASPSGSAAIPTADQFCKDTGLIWDSAALQAASPKTNDEYKSLIYTLVAATQELSVADKVGALDAAGAERIQRTMAITLVLMQDPTLAKKTSADIAKAAGMSAAQVDEARTQAFKDEARKNYAALGNFCAGVLKTASPAASSSASSSATASASAS